VLTRAAGKGGEVVSCKDGGVAVRLVVVILVAGAGMIVGKQGKTIKAINDKTGASPHSPRHRSRATPPARNSSSRAPVPRCTGLRTSY
jgi:hypothetical protein